MFAQLIHRLFTPKATPESMQDAVTRLTGMVTRLGRSLEDLSDEHEKLKTRYRAFEGRVYAWKRRELEPMPGTQEAQEPLGLQDPALTKAQVKQRLLEAGRLVPGKAPKH